jgi:hypothetical protein
MESWLSPRLGIRFELTPFTLNLYDHQGNLFLNPVQLRQRAEQEAQRAEREKSRADRLAAKLQALGIDPTDI